MTERFPCVNIIPRKNITMLTINKVVEMVNESYAELFTAMNQFHKLRIGDMFPDIAKSDGMLLMAIARLSAQKEGSVTVSELAEKVHAQNSAVSRSLRNLEVQGLIERTVNRADRRNTCVTLTEKGKKKQEEIAATMGEFGRSVVSQMSDEDVRRFTACLKEMYQIARQEIEKRSWKKKLEKENITEKGTEYGKDI